MIRKIFLLLFISGQAWAQQSTKYTFDDFMLIEKVEDQEKYYNKMLEQQPDDFQDAAKTNDFRSELAFAWLAKGNVKRYKYYKATNPKFSARQFLYLCNALEQLFDERKNYAAVEQISGELLEQIEKGSFKDPIGRTEVLMELNAAANAKLGNIELAKEMIKKASAFTPNTREIKYFRDSKSNFLNRYAIVMSAAGQHQEAFDTLAKAFKEAESNPYMVATFKEVFKKVKGSDKGFAEYIRSLKDEAYQKYYREIEKSYLANDHPITQGTIPSRAGTDKMLTIFQVKKPVGEITLQDLSGKAVNFADFKGKILVLDFWSTLCTPCVAAFKGFEKVIADYDKGQLQLFVINLFESQSTVKSYVAQKGIKLNVLRDEENLAYDIQATPTKIVFDQNGNIRFYGVGYAGSTDREYYKLKAMIEIIKERTFNRVTKQNK